MKCLLTLHYWNLIIRKQLAIIPIILFYILCQKYIVKGVMAGAVKG